MRHCLALVLLIIPFPTFGQHVLHGVVYAAGQVGKALNSVFVDNLHTSDTTQADEHGNFLLPYTSAGQLLRFRRKGYLNLCIRVQLGAETLSYRVVMTPGTQGPPISPDPFKICTFPVPSRIERLIYRREVP